MKQEYQVLQNSLEVEKRSLIGDCENVEKGVLALVPIQFFPGAGAWNKEVIDEDVMGQSCRRGCHWLL